jgi:hypothetical protein
MTGGRERLAEIVGGVVETTDENDTEVSLTDPVPDPMQAHVSDLRHPLRDGVGSNADDHLVVAKQRGGGLGVAMLAKILRSSVAMRAAAYMPTYSASATKEQTTGMRVE